MRHNCSERETCLRVTRGVVHFTEKAPEDSEGNEENLVTCSGDVLAQAKATSADLERSGRYLADRCFEQLKRQDLDGKTGPRWDIGNFPPRLFVLLATEAFRGSESAPFGELLDGIHKRIQEESDEGLDVSKAVLVGGSVAGVLTEGNVYLKGAALVCIASRFVRATVGIGSGASADPRAGAKDLCENLKLSPDELNPDANRFLLCFLPGFRRRPMGREYHAVGIHNAIREETRGRIPMVGGVTADSFRHEESWQFAGRKAVTDDSVAALVQSDLRFGIGMLNGLTQTDEFVYLENEPDTPPGWIVELSRRTADGLDKKPAAAILSEYEDQFAAQYGPENAKVLLGIGGDEQEGERIILAPQPQGRVISEADEANAPPNGSVYVGHHLPRHAPLEILRCTKDGLRDTPLETIQRTAANAQMAPSHLACALRFPCAGRYKLGDLLDWDRTSPLKAITRDFPETCLTAGLMFGEIGQGRVGHNLLRNWTVSSLLLGDELHPRSLHRRGYLAAVEAGGDKQRGRSETLEEAMSTSLDAIIKAGFCGAMISLVFDDNDPPGGDDPSVVIVAQDARGDGWEEIIDLTRRRRKREEDAGSPPMTREDILVKVVQGREAYFVADARSAPNQDEKAVDECGVVSYYVTPLRAPSGKILGTLQVDLGDMSYLVDDRAVLHKPECLPNHLVTLLDACAGRMAVAIAKAMRGEELHLSELCDRAVLASVDEPTLAQAAQKFVDIVTNPEDGLDLPMHIRLVTGDGENERLDLVAGHGDYYDLAKRKRPSLPIGIKPSSPTLISLETKKSRWVNNSPEDKASKDLLKSLEGKEDCKDLVEELRSMRSYANLAICPEEESTELAGKPIGVLTIASHELWFFSRSIRASLKALGKRLFLALEHARKIAEYEFLAKTTPHLTTEPLNEALKDHAKKIAKAASAEKVSFFLWDADRQELVLRGQFGWKMPEEEILGVKAYELGNGEKRMTGTLAEQREPIHIRNLASWKSTHGQADRPTSKFEEEMFGDDRTGATCEVIGIPLWTEASPEGSDTPPSGKDGYCLGILTMHNEIEAGGPTRFATTRVDVLKKVANDMAAFILASQASENRKYREERSKRLQTLASLLLKSVPDSYELARRICSQLTESYELEGCAVFLPAKRDTLRLEGRPSFPGSSVPLPTDLEFPLGNTILGSLLASRKKTYVWSEVCEGEAEPDESVRWAVDHLREGRLVSLLAIPLAEPEGLAEGVLVAWNIRRHGRDYPWFTQRDQSEFKEVSECLARAFGQQRHLVGFRRNIGVALLRANLSHLVKNKLGAIQKAARDLAAVPGIPKRTTLDTGIKKILGPCEAVFNENARYNAAVEAGLHEFEPFQLGEFIRDSLGEYCDLPAQEGVKIQGALAGDDVSIRGNIFSLIYAVRNMVNNSVSAINAAQIKNGAVQVLTDVDQEKLEISVIIRDNGPGMSEEKLERFSGMPTENTHDQRMPMGIYLTRFTCEQHGGRLQMLRRAEGGMDAVMTLPYLPK